MMLMYFAFSCLTLINGYPQYSKSSEDQRVADDNSDMYMEVSDQQTESSHQQGYVGVGEIQQANSQQFFPSFAPFHHPPLGHSRPFYQQEGAYSHRPSAYQQQHVGFDSAVRFSGYKGEQASPPNADAQGILGSGNFGVIHGGTFYSENDDVESVDPYSFYNGHGRPAYQFEGNPRPRQYQQFENFRDFADINVPSNSAYSQYVVVYANKNGSEVDSSENAVFAKPKNIIEHLALIDLEDEGRNAQDSEEKLSKSKRKLAKVFKGKKPFGKSSRQRTTEDTTTSSADLLEPLLAVS